MKYIPIQETQLAAMGAALVVGVGFAVLPLDAQTVLPGHSQAFHGVHKIGATPVHSPRPRTAENQFPTPPQSKTSAPQKTNFLTPQKGCQGVLQTCKLAP